MLLRVVEDARVDVPNLHQRLVDGHDGNASPVTGRPKEGKWLGAVWRTMRG